MRWLAALLAAGLSFLSLAMTGAVGLAPADRAWLFGASLGAMFCAGLVAGDALRRGSES